MLNRKTPDTLTDELTVKAPGDTFKVPIVFYNRSQDEREAYSKELLETEKGKNDIEWVNREMFLYIVKELDGEQPTNESVQDVERRYPGLIMGVFVAFHELRSVTVTKN